MPDRILIIKLGALGNIVLSLGPFAAIRRYHPDAEITLLTTEPYAAWLSGAPYFDRVWIDKRAAWWDVSRLRALRRQLITAGFMRIYDLQTSARSSWYYRLFPRPRPDWSGIASGCSHPDRAPDRNRLHDFERQAGQLQQAGISNVPLADLSWTAGDLSQFALPASFALLVPGSSAHRPGKRWPALCYAALATELASCGLVPVVLGSAVEGPLARAVIHTARGIDLTGRTGLGDLASLARSAKLAVGNDTGPMHLIASAGCPSVVLFSGESDPALCAPCGPAVRVLRRPRLTELAVTEVLATATALFSMPACTA